MRRLTTKNIKKDMWILDSKNQLGQIIHVHISVAKHINDTPFVYKLYKAHRVYTEVGPTHANYFLVIPTALAFCWRKLKDISNFLN